MCLCKDNIRTVVCVIYTEILCVNYVSLLVGIRANV